ncbi:contractile injection system tape measure protein [uncultured Winogradskyella sp.]|uniref:contractile injection system tape measure protein n=1 Tax=uncultured Winogradskyella sp. TaxID=395353 RepID=UPI00262CDD16|nr:contractile injection system tape measure protein [uncultured Winogradskyella sp.]
MTQSYTHIISRLKWDTSFDKKETAYEFQGQLSSWSKNYMPREINSIFDKACTQEQTWEIDSLELDLGVVNYKNLNYSLSKKLKEALQEKLGNLLLESNRGSRKLKILYANTSKIELIKTFLIQGYMPWNYESKNGSVNQILSSLLKNDKKEIDRMIKEIGVNENVRKRIAWQIKEENLLMIIEGLEPSNYVQIFDFANELTKIQQKKPIVQASSDGFRKNLWLWVLDYLLVERGTLFNKKTFIKSSIVKVANHYNIDYKTLIKSIDSAVKSIKDMSFIKPDFVIVLKELVKENALLRQKQGKSTDVTNYWEILTRMLRSNKKKTKPEKEKFNELIIALSKENKVKLADSLRLVYNSKSSWQRIVNDLSPSALEEVLKSITHNESNIIIESINFINEVGQEGKIKINQKKLLQIGLEYSLKHKSTSFNVKEFLKYFLTEFRKRDKSSEKQFYKAFNAVNVSSSLLKSDSTVSIYCTMKAFLDDRPHKRGFKSSDLQLKSLLEHFGKAKQKVVDNTFVMSIQQAFIDWVVANPTKAYKALLQWSDKTQLHQFLSLVLDSYTTDILLNSSEGSIRDLIFNLKNAIKETGNDTLIFVVTQSIKAFILNPELDATRLLNLLYKEHIFDMEKIHQDEFLNLFQEASENAKRPELEISKTVFSQLRSRIDSNKLPVFEAILKLMNNVGNRKVEVSEKLLTNIRNGRLTYAELIDTNRNKEVLNYLVKDGELVMNNQVERYFEYLKDDYKYLAKEEIKQKLIELFWVCVIDYSSYLGNTTQLIHLFNKAIMYAFPKSLSIEDLHQEALIKGRSYKLSNGNTLTQSQLTSEINAFFHSSSKKSKDYSEKELLSLAFEVTPNEVVKIIEANKTTDKQLNNLMQSISFQQFVKAIIYGAQSKSKSKEVIKSIAILENLSNQLVDGELREVEQFNYWKACVKALKSDVNAKVYLEEIVDKTLVNINKEAEIVYAEMETLLIKIPHVLKNILVAKNSVFRQAQTKNAKNELENFLGCNSYYNLEELCYSLIVNEKIPSWYISINKYGINDLLKKLVKTYPLVLFSVLKHRSVSDSKFFRLIDIIETQNLFSLIIKLNPTQKHSIKQFEHFYKAISLVSISGITSNQIQNIIFKIFIEAWLSGHWGKVMPNAVWTRLILELNVKRRISMVDFEKSIVSTIVSFPMAYQAEFYLITKAEQTKLYEKEDYKLSQDKIIPLTHVKKFEEPKNAIPITNAGLVLINTYFPLLFERLGLIEAGKFLSTASQLEAVHYLQYVATGISKTEEQYLILNKVLSGLSVETPVLDKIDIPNDKRKLIDGLVIAVTKHWSAIGNSSIEGFRGNWIIRTGLLLEREDAWELTVEKRAYDILINKSPFSFSIIKFPWMDKPLHVVWPY